MKKCYLFGMLALTIILSSVPQYMYALREITSEQEFDQVLQEEQNIIVDFYATWSGPSQHMMILLESVEKEFPKIVFVKVNVDSLRHLANIFKVRSLPTLIFFKGGQEAGRITELVPRNLLEEMIRNVYS